MQINHKLLKLYLTKLYGRGTVYDWLTQYFMINIQNVNVICTVMHYINCKKERQKFRGFKDRIHFTLNRIFCIIIGILKFSVVLSLSFLGLPNRLKIHKLYSTHKCKPFWFKKNFIRRELVQFRKKFMWQKIQVKKYKDIHKFPIRQHVPLSLFSQTIKIHTIISWVM